MGGGSITERMGFRRFDGLDYKGFDNLDWRNATGPSDQPGAASGSDSKPGLFGNIGNLFGPGGLQTETVVRVSDASLMGVAIAIGAGITIGSFGWYMVKKLIGG